VLLLGVALEPRRSVLLYTNLLAAPSSLRNWLVFHVRPCRCLKENCLCGSLRIAKETLIMVPVLLRLLVTVVILFIELLLRYRLR
jgi:hypothetical protein